jgi:hypothetical protein
VMGVLEATLAVIGLAALIGAIILWQLQRLPGRPTSKDLAAPYREGLHAAIRMQSSAQDSEHQLHAEAIRHAADDQGGKS